jgi:hypothetical protein
MGVEGRGGGFRLDKGDLNAEAVGVEVLGVDAVANGMFARFSLGISVSQGAAVAAMMLREGVFAMVICVS